jgi:hypothetical protein
MGSVPRSTKSLEISMSNYDNSPASMVRSSSTLDMHAQSSSSSTNRSCPSKECRSRACYSTSIASRISMFISCRERRVYHSSNVRLKLIECLELDEKVSILAR